MVQFADSNPFKGESNDSASSSDDASNDAQATLQAPSVEKKTSDATDSSGSDTIIETVKSAAETVRKKLHFENVHATGAAKFLNPTSIRAQIRLGSDDSSNQHGDNGPLSEKLDPRKTATVIWRSRDNRKGRNSIVVTNEDLEKRKSRRWLPKLNFSWREVGKNVLLMFVSFPYWDMAFWSGWSYSIGSAIFVIDGAWAWIPVAWPGEGEFVGYEWAVGLAFLIGALFYQVGATTAYLETVNDGSFQGSAMRRFLIHNDGEQKRMVDEKIHSFFGHLVPHPKKSRQQKIAQARANSIDPEAGWLSKDLDEKKPTDSVYPPGKEPAPRRGGIDYGEAEEGESTAYRTFRWLPTWHMLKTHHAFEIGFLACSIQLFGATLYTMCGIVALPPIIYNLYPWQKNGCYYGPEIVASVCFLVASIMFMIEAQDKWYKPEFTVIGWWIGLWATIGSVGFLLNGSFGPATYANDWAEYQSELSSMWGSAAYLLSGLLQWYEAINKNPVVELFNEPGQHSFRGIHEKSNCILLTSAAKISHGLMARLLHVERSAEPANQRPPPTDA